MLLAARLSSPAVTARLAASLLALSLVACGDPPRDAATSPASAAEPTEAPAVAETPTVVDPLTPTERAHLQALRADAAALQREVDAPFAASEHHSPLAADIAVETITAHALLSWRAPDAAAPPLQSVSPDLIVNAQPLQILPAAVQVRTQPAAAVVFHAPQLGTFANGGRTIAVQADAEGLATVDFRPGIDAGDYPILVVSPATSGMVAVRIEVPAYAASQP